MIFVQTQMSAFHFYKFSYLIWYGNGLIGCYFVNFHHFPTKAWLTSLEPVALNVELVLALASSLCFGRVSNECGCLRERSEQGGPRRLAGYPGGAQRAPGSHSELPGQPGAQHLASKGTGWRGKKARICAEVAFWHGLRVLLWWAVPSVPVLCWLRRWVMLNSLDQHSGPKWLRLGSEWFVPWCHSLFRHSSIFAYLLVPARYSFS